MCEICRLAPDGDPIDEAWAWEQVLQKYRATIRRVGWMVTYVPEQPTLAYTSGLCELGQPELVVFGMCQHCAAGTLNTIARRVVQGSRLRDGGQVRYRGYPLKAFALPNPDEILVVTHSLYARRPGEQLAALQLVYADGEGRWPWEPECAIAGGQPMPGTFQLGASS